MKLIDEIFSYYYDRFEISPEAMSHLERIQAAINKGLVSDDKRCSVCGAKVTAYWHKLTPALVKALRLIHARYLLTGINRVHISSEIPEMNKTLYNNFQKLRFHALVAKCKKDGMYERGYWLITTRGFNFLNNGLRVPYRVKTFRNKVKDHDTKRLVGIEDVMGTDPYIETIDDIDRAFEDVMKDR